MPLSAALAVDRPLERRGAECDEQEQEEKRVVERTDVVDKVAYERWDDDEAEQQMKGHVQVPVQVTSEFRVGRCVSSSRFSPHEPNLKAAPLTRNDCGI